MKRDYKSASSLLSNRGGAPLVVNSQQNVIVSEVKHRMGMVLNPSTIIKVDDYLFRHSPQKVSWFPRRVSGAEELRIAEGTSIIGVAQPTLPGIRGILDALNAGRMILSNNDKNSFASKKKVLWINLREEALLYLNGRPIVLREREEPFRNIETFKGINESRLKDLEWRFKEDVIAEAQRCGGSVLLHEEEGENQLLEKWESAPPSAVMTAEDVFFQLRQEGYRVKYERIPCTSGQPPQPGFFDELINCVNSTDRDTWIIFNCQSGNARSTVAMIATCAIQARRGLIRLNSNEGVDEMLSPDKKRHPKPESLEEVEAIQLPPTATPPIFPPRSISPSNQDSEKDETARQLLAGWYLPILQMLRLLLGGGREAKLRMDSIIDRCSHVSNIRSQIFRFRSKATNMREKAYRSLLASRASVALQRYMILILFEAYLNDRSTRESTFRQSNLATPKSAFPIQHLTEEFAGLPSNFGSASDLDSLLMSRAAKHQRSISRDIVESLGPSSSEFRPPSFHDWLENRKEILTLLKSVLTDPESALEVNSRDFLVTPDGSSSESRQVLSARRGVMLNTDTILKLDNFEPSKDSDGKEAVHNFRKVSGMRVYGVATPAVFELKTMIRVIQTYHSAQRLMFCNLREEPFVYINEKPFVLRSVHRPFRNLNAFADIDAKRLEKAEERMKKEILQEAERYEGKILVHSEEADGTLKVVWEEIEDEEAVQTPKEVFSTFASDEGLPVSYVRIPMTAEAEPGLSDIDEILHTVRKLKSESGTHFVFFCQRGRGRSTIATILACLELDEFLPTDDTESLSLMRGSIPAAVPRAPSVLSNDEVPSLNGSPGIEREEKVILQNHDHDELSSASTDFPPMLSLIRVLRHGTMAKRWLDATVDRCGSIVNIRKNILSLSVEAQSARSEEQSIAKVESALLDLKKYFILLEVAGYTMEMKLSKNPPSISFKDWCQYRPELLTLKEEIRDKSSLRLLSAGQEMQGDVQTDDGVVTVNDASSMSSLVANRKGRVLVRGHILKTDHFPGCRRLPDAKIDIDGAPNFRSVWPEGKLEDIDLRVYGTGIPTEPALGSILKLLSTYGQKEEIVWINLREEPILYLNGRPFVLRKFDEPFSNLEHTGISRSRVEEMEIRFKEDVLEEAEASPEHAVLIHEEDISGGLSPKWEKVETVCTPRELFDAFKDEFTVHYWRIPITDEQSPKPSAFDAIVDIVASYKQTSHIVFNCQMGRGRTTSGLVVACATRLRKIGALRRFASVVDEQIAPRRKFRSKIRANTGDIPPEVAKELRGDYLAILAQIRLMDDGLDAKKAMDALIDVCDAMQNLREAIHEIKLRANKVDITPALKAEALGVAEHYLKRYAHLVQFTAYLLSLNDLTPKRMKFANWLKGRPELGNALKALAGDGKRSVLSS